MDHRYEQRFIAQEKAVHDAFVASEKAVQAALHSAEKAVEKALASNDRRLEAMNEFRASLSDLQATLITRREAQAMIDGMSNRVDDLKERSDQGQGKDTGGDHVWAMLFATIATVGTLVAIGLGLFAATGR